MTFAFEFIIEAPTLEAALKIAETMQKETAAVVDQKLMSQEDEHE